MSLTSPTPLEKWDFAYKWTTQ